MTYVDSAVLDFTERICRRFQTWTGRTNVWLAFHLTNLSIVIYFAGVGVLILGNHGLVVAAETVAEAERRLHRVRSLLARPHAPTTRWTA